LIDVRTGYFLKRYPHVTITSPGGATVQRPAAQVLLHIVPLFPPTGGLDLADEAILKTFESVPPFFNDQPSGDHRMSLEGYMNFEWREERARADRSVQLLRRGALEFHILDAAASHPAGVILDAIQLEAGVLRALEQSAAMADAGLVMLPALVSLRLLRMGGAALFSQRFHLERHSLGDAGDALLDPLLVNDWPTELDSTARRLFDVVWQAYGFRRCFHYDERGNRILG
jgi:hypothetical protein